MGDAFVYAPLTAIPITWLTVLAWHRLTLGADSGSAIEWLLLVLTIGVLLNYLALAALGIPACYLLLRWRVRSLVIFGGLGAILGALTTSVYPGWYDRGWVLTGAVAGAWNAAVIWYATTRADRQSRP